MVSSSRRPGVRFSRMKVAAELGSVSDQAIAMEANVWERRDSSVIWRAQSRAEVGSEIAHSAAAREMSSLRSGPESKLEAIVNAVNGSMRTASTPTAERIICRSFFSGQSRVHCKAADRSRFAQTMEMVSSAAVRAGFLGSCSAYFAAADGSESAHERIASMSGSENWRSRRRGGDACKRIRPSPLPSPRGEGEACGSRGFA